MSKSGIPVVSDIGKVGGQIVKPLAPILKTVAPILPFLPIPGLGPLSALATRSLLTGIASGLDKSGNFNFNRGLKAGALAYGVGSLMNAANANTLTGTTSTAGEGLASNIDPSALESMSAADVSAATAGMPMTTSLASNIDPAALEGMSKAQVDATIAGMPQTGYTGAPITGSGMGPTSYSGAAPTGPAPVTDVSNTANLGTSTDQFMANRAADSTAGGLANLAGAGGEYVANLGSRALDYAMANPVTTALGATTAYGSYKSMQELEKAKEEADRILQDQENKKASDIAWAQSVLRDYPLEYKRLSAADVIAQRGMAMGGLTALARGGRFLEGPGDGTSDSIPARIGGRQEARLADGEFVVDARTVSELGNGSSKAGAKKLYAMMDRVHAARRGAKRGKPSDADKYMPA